MFACDFYIFFHSSNCLLILLSKINILHFLYQNYGCDPATFQVLSVTCPNINVSADQNFFTTDQVSALAPKRTIAEVDACIG